MRPKRITPDRILLGAIAGGMAINGEKPADFQQMVGVSQTTYYNRMKEPQRFTLEEFRIIAKHYRFTPETLCQIIGIPTSTK